VKSQRLHERIRDRGTIHSKVQGRPKYVAMESTISTVEEQRLENIKRNRVLLKDMGIHRSAIRRYEGCYQSTNQKAED